VAICVICLTQRTGNKLCRLLATKAATKPAEFGNKCCGPAAQLSPKSGRESKNVSKRERAASGNMRPAAGRQVSIEFFEL